MATKRSGVQRLSTYQTSKSITAPLKSKIVSQSHNLPTEEEVARARLTTMQHVHNDQATHADNVRNQQPVELQRKLKQISEPGASSWIGALPLSQYGLISIEVSFRMLLL